MSDKDKVTRKLDELKKQEQRKKLTKANSIDWDRYLNNLAEVQDTKRRKY